MNAAHLHLILVHIPLVLLPTATIILIIAMWRRQPVITTTALSIFIVATLVCIPAYLLGEEAEELVEHQPGVSERTIEEHEEAADVSLWFTIAAGSGALLALALQRPAPALQSVVLKALVAVGALASGTLSYTAYEGGRIKHPEAYQDATSLAAEDARAREHHN